MTPPTPAIGRPPAPAQLNPLSAAIKRGAEGRRVECFDLAEFGFFLPLEKSPPRVGVRTPTSFEQDCAYEGAKKYAAEIAGSTDALKHDDTIVRNAMGAFIAYEACREMRETEPGSGQWEPTGNPAFMGPKWLTQHLDVDRISVLLNLINEVRAKCAPSPVEIDDSTVEAYLSLCSTAEQPEYSMAGCSREYLCQLAILLSVKLAGERVAAAERDAELTALRARVAELEAAAAGAAK